MKQVQGRLHFGIEMPNDEELKRKFEEEASFEKRSYHNELIKQKANNRVRHIPKHKKQKLAKNI